MILPTPINNHSCHHQHLQQQPHLLHMQLHILLDTALYLLINLLYHSLDINYTFLEMLKWNNSNFNPKWSSTDWAINLTICLLMDSLTKAKHCTVNCCCLIIEKHCLPDWKWVEWKTFFSYLPLALLVCNQPLMGTVFTDLWAAFFLALSAFFASLFFRVADFSPSPGAAASGLLFSLPLLSFSCSAGFH